MSLPQPPEGVLDPKIPWYTAKVGERTWKLLKARLTGRKMDDGTHYSSFVNLTEADANRLIENLKKDPRGYPQFNNTGGAKEYENLQKYQEWLVEEYLEKPFRKQTNDKIEAAEVEARVKEIQENKKKIASSLNKPKQNDIQPQQKIVDPWSGSYSVPSKPLIQHLKVVQQSYDAGKTPPMLPPAAPEELQQSVAAAEPPKVKSEEEKQKKSKRISVPNKLSTETILVFDKYKKSLDGIVKTLNNQTTEYNAQLLKSKKILTQFKSVNQILGNQIQTYKEFFDDRESQVTENIIESVTDENVDTISQSNSQVKLAKGGIVTGDLGSSADYLEPGIYDKPTTGNLKPGTAVIPLNRNYGKDIFGSKDIERYSNSLAQLMIKPASAMLGAVVAKIGEFLTALGPLAGFFNAGIRGLIGPLSGLMGVTDSIVTSLLGGKAYAGVEDNEEDKKSFYKQWKTFLDDNNLGFFGAGGITGGGLTSGEIAEDILTIGSEGEGLRFKGGTNVGKAPAWIPFSKSDSGKIGYVSGFGWRWGRQHSGIDLDGDRGIKIISPFAGTVFDINRNWPQDNGGGYGNLVGIQHDNPKIFTFYGHLQDVANQLNIGTKVKAGEVIGTLGSTGRSTGPHLHWEVRTSQNGGQIDPVEWTHENKPSLASGGWIKIITDFASKILKKPSGLSHVPLKRIMHGTKQGVPDLIRATGFRGQSGMIGKGVYGSTKGWVADTYRGAGAWKGIIPGQGPRLDLLVPQASKTFRGATVVSERQANRGLRIAEGILSGKYTGPKAQSLLPLLNKATPTMAQAFKTGILKFGGRFIGVLNLPVIGDAIDPAPTSSFDQISGPNAYYNAPGYKGPKVYNVNIPAQSQPQISSTPSPKINVVDLPMSTQYVESIDQMRRIR
jgi:murein DD-endopeptidase MepM/ murein hydrolase activator NlpD